MQNQGPVYTATKSYYMSSGKLGISCSNRPSSGNCSKSRRTLRVLEGCQYVKSSNQMYSTQMTNFLAIQNNAVPLNYVTRDLLCFIPASLVQSRVFELIQMYEAPDVKRFYLQ